LCKETGKWWESQGEENSYSPAALAGGIRTGAGTWGGHGAKNLKPLFTHLFGIFHSVGPAPLFPPPPPAQLVIQEEEAKESNIVLEIGLEGQ